MHEWKKTEFISSQRSNQLYEAEFDNNIPIYKQQNKIKSMYTIKTCTIEIHHKWHITQL